MAIATFDFTNLRIILPSGDVTIEVERDLYSAWKRAVLLSSANMSAPPAFRPSVGGDSLSPGIEAGAYYFLQNQDGWRIRPAEEDASVTFTGNLAAEDPALSMTVPTIGAFTVLLNGLQPITQSVELLLLAQQDANYLGEVFYDSVGGAAGTEFPVGTASTPSNNVSDFFAIADRLGLKHMRIINSMFAPDRDMQGWDVGGLGVTARFDTGGFDVSGSEIHDLDVIGDFSASTNVRIDRGHALTLINFQGHVHDSGLVGTLSLAGSTVFVRCFSSVVGQSTPVVDCQDLVLDVSFRGLHGGMEIRNFSQVGNKMSVDIDSGRLILGASVTQGDIVIRGVGVLEDGTGPAVVPNTDGFLDATDAHTGLGVIDELRKLMRNKMVTDPVTGVLTVFDDDGTTVLFQANLFEDAGGLQAYRGKGAERRERLALLDVFGPEFGLEFS